MWLAASITQAAVLADPDTGPPADMAPGRRMSVSSVVRLPGTERWLDRYSY